MKKELFIFLVLIFIFPALKTFAQLYQLYLNIPVTQNGVQITNPWTGGFDAPVLQPIDLNGDGIKDLFAFEKGGASEIHFRYSTFINMGTPNQADYVFAPQYENYFPPNMHDWVLLYDYDCDGKEDIFTYAGGAAMAVYHNDFAGSLSFHKEYDTLFSNYNPLVQPLFVSSANQPALADVDNDGDLDVLTFVNTGYSVEYHKNLAQENFSRCDTLVYNLETACWGNFSLSSFVNKAILNISCRLAHYTLPLPDKDKSSLHSGSCAIAPDLDGDGDKEFVNGDILGNNILYLENGGTPASANITSQDTLFPSYTLPADFRSFPAAYYFDADNDGNKDFIVTGCNSAARNFKNVLFYKNTTNNTTNVFNYTGDSLFVNEMIDIGSGANVALTDIDGDGLQDMIIGNYKYTYQETPDTSSVAYYRNTGTANQPSFDLVTRDFSGLSTFGVYGIYPSFGDLDNDGDKDMIIGTSDGYIDYLENTAGPGNLANYVLTQVHISDINGTPINIGTFAAPCIVDLNRDGKSDLVIGEKFGNLNYYENTGTPSNPVFTYVTSNLGGVSVVKTAEDLYGYTAPFFYDSLGIYKLYSGSLSGYIYKYDNIDNNLTGIFNLVDSMYFYEPIRSTITGTDINADNKMDFLIGNYAGGVEWYSNTTTSVNENASVFTVFNLYPNPVKDLLHLHFYNIGKSIHREIIISDLLGKTIYSCFANADVKSIDLRQWTNGMYVCKVIEGSSVINKKFIIQH